MEQQSSTHWIVFSLKVHVSYNGDLISQSVKKSSNGDSILQFFGQLCNSNTCNSWNGQIHVTPLPFSPIQSSNTIVTLNERKLILHHLLSTNSALDQSLPKPNQTDPFYSMKHPPGGSKKELPATILITFKRNPQVFIHNSVSYPCT